MSRERIVSLRTVLSWITGLIIVLLVASICVIAYFSAYGEEKNVYIDELHNFNKDIAAQVDSFYQDNLNEARFLAGLEAVKTAAQAERPIRPPP